MSNLVAEVQRRLGRELEKWISEHTDLLTTHELRLSYVSVEPHDWAETGAVEIAWTQTVVLVPREEPEYPTVPIEQTAQKHPSTTLRVEMQKVPQ